MQPQSSNVQREDDLSTLTRALAPCQVRITYCGGHHPFELAWDNHGGSMAVRGETLASAAAEGLRCLLRLTGHQGEAKATEPEGDTSFAEAMRELIERTRPVPARPRLCLVR